MLNEPGNVQSDANATTRIDEHDEPTEPMRCSDLSAFAATIPNGIASPDEEDIPVPKTSTQPFPHQYVQPPLVGPNKGFQQAPENGGVYPYLPPKPVDPSGNRPAGGGVPVQPEAVKVPTQGQRVHGNLIPIVVGMCFVAIQALLLLRFILKLLNVSSDISWVGAVYGVSNVFILPFRLLFLQFAIPLLFTAEIYTLLAILVYGLISRIIVRVLKALLSTR
ncbi:MAG: hypothetical protein NVS4B11_25660 [Ktedonobacteraceae bacterium]